MIQTLAKNWLLLAASGVLQAIISATYLTMYGTDGPLNFHAWGQTLALLGQLTLAAGVCAIAAGSWRSALCWPLVLNGLALASLGLICSAAVRFRISLLTIAFLIVLMATSLGALEWLAARTLRGQHRIAGGWRLRLAGVVSLGFAVGFLALGLRWIKTKPGSLSDLLWLGAYFGFSAVCMVDLALRLRGQGLSPIQSECSFTVGKPKTHA